MIRRATVRDIEGMLALGRRVHAAAETYPPLDELQCRRMAAFAVQSKQYIALVDDHENEIRGIFLGTTDKLAYSQAKYATDVLFIAERPFAAVRMLKEFVAWAKPQKVWEITCAVSSGNNTDRMERFYARLGFTKIGGLFQIKGIKA